MADENRFSWPAFVSGASNVDHLPDAVVVIHHFALGRFVNWLYVHGSDESRFGSGVTAMAVCFPCRIPNAHPFAEFGQYRISLGSARGTVSN
jgi:hypothetical protein